jgi:hypothetical protein
MKAMLIAASAPGGCGFESFFKSAVSSAEWAVRVAMAQILPSLKPVSDMLQKVHIDTYPYIAATAKPQAGSKNVCGRSIRAPVSGRLATISVTVYMTQATIPPATA